ncbi:MAG: glutathione S-transferase family protein [Gammaproteobacteria bacterium]
MKLFDFQRAPNPRRVRLFIAEKGLDLQHININLYRMEQLSSEFLSINPGGTVPVLETDDGVYLTEGVAICHYLEQLHPEPCLMGSTPLQQANVLMWNNIVENEGISAAAEILRNISPGFRDHALSGQTKIPQIPALVQRGQLRFQEFLGRIEKQLGEHPWLAGPEYSFADMSLLATLEYATWVDIDARDSNPAIHAWWQRMDKPDGIIA